MTEKAYRLSPVDSWFFRDGRPYNKGESNQTDVKSIFPPFAPTLVGVLRVAFARNMDGWNGHGDWPDHIKKKLGDGQELAPLKFKGPYLLRTQEEEGIGGKEKIAETLFPAPLHLLGGEPLERSNEKWSFTRLCPGKEVLCDMGKLRLPEPEEMSKKGEKEIQRKKLLSDYYLTRSDMETLLISGNLDTIRPVHRDSLWEPEFNVGIERNEQTRTTEEGALFSRQFIRLNKDVSILVKVDGIGEGMKPETAVTFGGESRMAYIEEIDPSIQIFPGMPELKPNSSGKVRFTATFLTPADISTEDVVSGKEIPGLPGVKLVSACIGKPVYIGGWDSRKGKNGPLPLRQFIPAGSTFFCEADNLMSVDRNEIHIGNKTEFGYGQIAIGVWNDSQNRWD